MTDIGHNTPSPEDKARAALEHALEKVSRWKAEAISEANAPLLREDIAAVGVASKAAFESRRAAKKPHEDAAKAVDVLWKPIEDGLEKAAKELKLALTAYLDRVERERKAAAAAAAKKAAEEAAAAEEAKRRAEAESDPFEAFAAHTLEQASAEKAAEAQALATQRVNVAGAEGARAQGLRSFWSAEITDATALVAHYAMRQSVIDAALQCAHAEMRASKGQAQIPGVKAKEDRRVA